MLKRFDRYVARGADGAKDDGELLEEIYMPEMTRNGLEVEEVGLDELDGPEKPEEKAIYTCSLCPDRQMKSLKEVRVHIASRSHRRRENMNFDGLQLTGDPDKPTDAKKRKLHNAKMRLVEAQSTYGKNDKDEKRKEEKKSKKKSKKDKKQKRDQSSEKM